jgi:lambda repressor-like predicted transcriptional regulator
MQTLQNGKHCDQIAKLTQYSLYGFRKGEPKPMGRYLAGLKKRGYSVHLSDSKKLIVSPKLPTYLHRQVADAKENIIAELLELQPIPTIPSPVSSGRFDGLSEAELDEVGAAYSKLFRYAALRGYSATQCWEPREPKPTRPYVYLDFGRLIPAGGTQQKLYIWPIEAAADGVDYCLMLGL